MKNIKKIKCGVVMLNTEDKKAPILSYLNDERIQHFPNEYWANNNLSKRHLYILSEEPIKEGDWCYKVDKNGIVFSIFNTNIELYKDAKKIIASTDTSLLKPGAGSVNSEAHLPLLSTSFIIEFIENFNSGRIMTEVIVDYELDKNLAEQVLDATKLVDVDFKYKPRVNTENYIIGIEEDIFEKKFIESLDFTVVSDDGQYGKAISNKAGGKKLLKWNREGFNVDYFGIPMDKNCIFAIRDDWDTRYTFNGFVRSKEHVKLLIELTT